MSATDHPALCVDEEGQLVCVCGLADQVLSATTERLDRAEAALDAGDVDQAVAILGEARVERGREHPVPCIRCHRPTFADSAICELDRCQQAEARYLATRATEVQL